MDHDYYAILGVGADADLATLRKAFRARARVCHPDRGGSHEEMKLVLEARDVLFNPESRARYDAVRRGGASAAAQTTAAADVQEARQRAERYPPTWAEFEEWLNILCNDFAEAKHGSVPLWADLRFPTVQKSVSGIIFILAGAALGGLLLSGPAWMLADAMHWRSMIRFVFAALPIIGGAWVGAAMHKGISDTLRGPQTTAAPTTSNASQSSASSPEAAPGGGAEAWRTVISCARCGQRLRVPDTTQELIVTCVACRHRFSYRPESQVHTSDPQS